MSREVKFQYEAIPQGYYDEVYHRLRGAQSKWHHLKFAEVAALVPPARNLLDIGCGPGTFIGMYSHAENAIGIDISSAQIEYAAKRYAAKGRKFITTIEGKLPFVDETFDVVTSIELIEHLELAAVHGLMDEIVRVLKPGGHLVLTTPNYGSLWPLLEMAVNTFGVVGYEDQHITHFDRAALVKLLCSYPLRDIAVRSFLGLAAFTAPLHWRLADAIHQSENRWQVPFFRFSLLASATK